MLSRFFLACLLVLPLQLSAAEIEIDVVRQGADIYEISGRDLFLYSPYCFAGEEQAKVMLTLEGSAATQMRFSDSDSSCDVVMTYGVTELEEGDYKFTVSRLDEGWYAIDGQDAAFRTSGCYSLVESAVAVVRVNGNGGGRLILTEEDEECDIVGIYGKAELEISEQEEQQN